ncbi:MAG: hypothetical protein IT383_12325 [Deltaproteobacteria bacterium]|nr:hypothetical protein [Deltaproteobacteria bacterium]
MYLRARHAIALALLAGALSVLLYRLLDGSRPDEVVVAPPPPPAPPPPVPAPLDELAASYQLPVTLPDEVMRRAIVCRSCDAELAQHRRVAGSLATRMALDLCMQSKCATVSDAISSAGRLTSATLELLAHCRDCDAEHARYRRAPNAAPAFEALEACAKHRCTASAEVVELRLAQAQQEVSGPGRARACAMLHALSKDDRVEPATRAVAEQQQRLSCSGSSPQAGHTPQ